MRTQQLLATTLVSAVLALSTIGNRAVAHDTDIYVRDAGDAGSTPQLMIMLDLRSSVMNSNNLCSQTDSEGVSVCADYAPYLLDVSGNSIAPSSAKNLDVYRAAIIKILQEEVASRPNASMKVGLMIPHDQTNCNSTKCSNGGYILLGFTPVKVSTSPGIVNPRITAALRAIPSTGNHPLQASETFFEFKRYLTGGAVFNGFKGWYDYGTNNTWNISDEEDWGDTTNAELSWDTRVINGATAELPTGTGRYISPLGTECAKVYTLSVIFGTLNQDADDHDTRSAELGGLPNTNNDRFVGTLEYLYDTDLDGDAANGQQNVQSYFIVPQAGRVENSFARAGSGGTIQTATEMGETPDAFATAFRNILLSVLSTSVAGTAPTVSVNVYNRSQIMKDVFIAMFQAEEGHIWPGNIKKFALEENDSGVLEIQDVLGQNAVNANDGRIKQSALSFWTIRDDLPAPNNDPSLDIGKDGRAVDRGAAGSKIPGFKLLCDNTDYTTDTSCRPGQYTPGLLNPTGRTTATSARKVFTEQDTVTNGSANALMPLNANSTTAGNASIQAALGATSTGSCETTDTNTHSACNLIKFARGMYIDGVNRTWMMGDVLHSRPLAINYGTLGGHPTTNPNIRLFVGSNDGSLRMIRNTDASTTPVQEGIEGWAFMPRATLGIVGTLATSGLAASDHPYGVDGTPTAYVIDNDGDGNIEINGQDGVANNADDDKVYVFFGLGRGGKAYYGLNVTDPDNPTQIWRIQKTDAAFAELGQTWSPPSIARMVFDGNTTAKPVLIFGGGYDPNKDDNISVMHEAAPGGDDSQGNAIFIIDAMTGALVWKAVKTTDAGLHATYNATNKAYQRTDLKDSIPSAVTALDANGNGLVDRLYVGDTGGVVWRADLYSNNQANWTLVPIMSVGRHYNAADKHRRFFNPPDFVQVVDDAGERYDAVIIGTGDRENPLSTPRVCVVDPVTYNTTCTVPYAWANYFYVFKDKDITSGVLDVYNGAGGGVKTHANFGDITSNCLQDNTCATPPDLTWGWRLKLECPHIGSPEGCGEKNLAAATTIDNVVYFTTYIPPDALESGCTPIEGEGLLYAVDLNNGTAVIDYDTTTAGLTTSDRYDKLNAPGIPTELVNIGNGKLLDSGLNIRETTMKSGFRTFWYQPGR